MPFFPHYLSLKDDLQYFIFPARTAHFYTMRMRTLVQCQGTSSVVGYASITFGPRTTYVMGTSLHPIRIAHAYNSLKACVRETPRLLSVRRKSPPASLLCFHAYEFHVSMLFWIIFTSLSLVEFTPVLHAEAVSLVEFTPVRHAEAVSLVEFTPVRHAEAIADDG